jgi:hypothetical protein
VGGETVTSGLVTGGFVTGGGMVGSLISAPVQDAIVTTNSVDTRSAKHFFAFICFQSPHICKIKTFSFLFGGSNYIVLHRDLAFSGIDPCGMCGKPILMEQADCDMMKKQTKTY